LINTTAHSVPVLGP